VLSFAKNFIVVVVVVVTVILNFCHGVARSGRRELEQL
jgi:fumarate reductase subunit D